MDVFSTTSTSSFSSHSTPLDSVPAGSSLSSNLHGFVDTHRHPDKLTSKDDGVRCVIVPKDVIICYGPYMVQGILDYRLERLQGLQNAFYKLGVHTILQKAHHINLLKIFYMDTMIFSCKMTDLHHGGDGTMDIKCKQAVKIFQMVFHKAGHEIRQRQRQLKMKEDKICRLCVCGTKQKKFSEIPHIYEHAKSSTSTHSAISESGSSTSSGMFIAP